MPSSLQQRQERARVGEVGQRRGAVPAAEGVGVVGLRRVGLADVARRPCGTASCRRPTGARRWPGPARRAGCPRRSAAAGACGRRSRRRSGRRGVRAAQQLVAEVAVAVLDVDEVEAGALRQHRGLHEARRQVVEVVVGQQRHRAVGADAAVEHRVRVRRERLRLLVRVGARVAARVGQLQADDQVVGAEPGAAVTREQVLAQLHEVGLRRRTEAQLVRVGAAVVAHGDRLAAPDQLRAALAEALPAAPRQVGRAAVGRAVPAFHRQDAEAVAGAAGRSCRSARRAASPARPRRPARRAASSPSEATWASNWAAVLSAAMRG